MPRQPWGNAVHRGSAFLDDWPYLLTIDRLRDHRVGVPDQACNVLDRDVMLREQRHEAVPKLPRCPVLAGEGGVVEYFLKSRRMLWAVIFEPFRVENTSSRASFCASLGL
jgi:hypothetical protein